MHPIFANAAKSLALASAFGALLPGAARAEVRSEVLLVLGAEVPGTTDGAIVERLRAAGLELVRTPSLTWSGDTRKPRLHAGLVLARMSYKAEVEVAGAPLPSPTDVERVRRAFADARLAAEVSLTLVLQHSGGK